MRKPLFSAIIISIILIGGCKLPGPESDDALQLLMEYGTSFRVGGTVSGYTGSGLVLQNNGGDDLAITDNSAFVFETPVQNKTKYEVTVLTQPAGQICAVGGGDNSNGGGTVSSQNVEDVTVTCSTQTYSITATVNGLAGDGLVIQNGADTVTVNQADGSGPFPLSILADGTPYLVTVKTQPSGVSNESCSVTANGSGTLSGADVNVTVNCEVCDIAHMYGGANFDILTYDPGGAPASISVCLSGLNSDDVYFSFTNVGGTAATLPAGSGTGFYSQIASPVGELQRDHGQGKYRGRFINHVPDWITRFNNSRPGMLQNFNQVRPPLQKPNLDKYGGTVGTTTETWYDDATGIFVPSTLRGTAILSSGKTLKVWVADDMWVAAGDADHMINAAKVAQIVSHFGTASPNIYDMVRKLVGAEWGTHMEPDLISSLADTEVIHIFLTDINQNGPWGTVGYFSGCDTTLWSYAYCFSSNEALIFFIDAPTFGEMEGLSWEITDVAPTRILGTLAHEFQHMIHFYQKMVVLSVPSEETWLNEMASTVVQDMVATQVGGAGTGPANDPAGRLADYVYTPVCDITVWSTSDTGECNVYDSYATAYAFGGYLVRHYGGSTFLKDIVQSSGGGMDAVDYALTQAGAGIDHTEALRRWGASLAMNPNLGTPGADYAYPQVIESSFYGTGADLTLQLGDMYGLAYAPRIYSTPPLTLRTNATVVWRKYNGITGETNSSNTTITVPANTLLTITVGPN